LRLTQEEIARRAGVSQATVSLVLNGAKGSTARIPPDTRRKVEAIIAETGYVADPVARRMAQGRNRILGVFTYEPAFPTGQADFFAPFLFGIEEAAQELGHDLLLMTAGARDADGRKRLFGEGSRLRLADGCLLLGRSFNREELARLVADGFPFVAIGRRDDIGGPAGGPVPFVGGDYAAATADLVRLALARGHRAFAYVGPSDDVEASRDRWKGLRLGLEDGGRLAAHVPVSGAAPGEVLAILRRSGATVALFTERADAAMVRRAALDAGLRVPEDLSFMVLGSHVRTDDAVDFTTYAIPREEMGRLATQALVARLDAASSMAQTLLPCRRVDGSTLAPPPSGEALP
jgi:DNA-binding LacI/PurR family transcriptional regulator